MFELFEVIRNKWVYYHPLDDLKFYCSADGVRTLIYRRNKRRREAFKYL